MKDPREVIIRPVITEHSYDMMNKNTYTSKSPKTPTRLRFARPSSYLQCDRDEGEHPERQVEAEARSYAAGSHPHLEEGHGYAERRRHHRALQRVSSFLNRPLGFSTKRAQHA